MYLKTLSLNHDQANLNTALGLSNETQLLCRERILFTHFNNSLQAVELFEDMDDAPKELRTVTGDLQSCLQMIEDPLQYEFTLLTFFQHHRVATDMFNLYRMMTDESLPEEHRLKAKLASIAGDLAIKKALEEKREEQKDDPETSQVFDDMDSLAEQLTPSSLLKRIKLVKKSRSNFNRYLDMLNNRSTDSEFDIDDLLNNAINGKD